MIFLGPQNGKNNQLQAVTMRRENDVMEEMCLAPCPINRRYCYVISTFWTRNQPLLVRDLAQCRAPSARSGTVNKRPCYYRRVTAILEDGPVPREHRGRGLIPPGEEGVGGGLRQGGIFLPSSLAMTDGFFKLRQLPFASHISQGRQAAPS